VKNIVLVKINSVIEMYTIALNAVCPNPVSDWILTYVEAIQLAYRVGLLMCPLVPEIMHGRVPV
jgi:hypothetical protein